MHSTLVEIFFQVLISFNHRNYLVAMFSTNNWLTDWSDFLLGSGAVLGQPWFWAEMVWNVANKAMRILNIIFWLDLACRKMNKNIRHIERVLLEKKKHNGHFVSVRALLNCMPRFLANSFLASNLALNKQNVLFFVKTN